MTFFKWNRILLLQLGREEFLFADRGRAGNPGCGWGECKGFSVEVSKSQGGCASPESFWGMALEPVVPIQPLPTHEGVEDQRDSG